MTEPRDTDTMWSGTEPPFKPWEDDHTALVHVLWSAKHQGLTLEKDADSIATMILHSRWMAAREHKARQEGTSND